MRWNKWLRRLRGTSCALLFSSLAIASTGEPWLVQGRVLTRAERFEITGPSFGRTERGDFFSNWTGSLGVRYFLSEDHGWEILRGSYNLYGESALASELREKSNLVFDAKPSRLQLSSSYLYSPVYGKYAFGGWGVVHFSGQILLGGGIRFADRIQPFFETGLAMSHLIVRDWISLIPEWRFRAYFEERTERTFVTESLIQIGFAWML